MKRFKVDDNAIENQIVETPIRNPSGEESEAMIQMSEIDEDEEPIQVQGSEEVQNVVFMDFTENESKKNNFLFYAALLGDHKNLAIFLKTGKYPEIGLEGINYQPFPSLHMTPLHIAASNGYVKCVQIFIEDYGMDVNCQDDRLRTPLHLAASSNNVECVKQLIQSGADCSLTDENGSTSLNIAAESGFNECLLAQLSIIFNTNSLSQRHINTLKTGMCIVVQKGMADSFKAMVRPISDENIPKKLTRFLLIKLVCEFEQFGFDAKKEILKVLLLEGENIVMSMLNTKYGLKLNTFLMAYGTVAISKDWESYLQRELFTTNFPNFLECFVNFVPRLPFLQTFKVFHYGRPYPLITERHETFPEADEIWLDFELPKDVTFELALRKEVLYVKMIKIPDDSAVATEPLWPDERRWPTSRILNRRSQISFVKYIPLKQPFLDLVCERLTEKLADLAHIDIGSNLPPTIQRLEKKSILKLQQRLWYHNIASNPRTLQHHCRYAIRKHLGHSILKCIRKLPLPEKLQAFLCFE